MNGESSLHFDFPGELEKFDNVRFCTMCRTMRVRLVHRDVDAAVRLVKAFVGDTSLRLATMDSAIADVLPVRLVNYLEDAGFLTLRAVDGALDAEIASIPGMGSVYIAEIRDTIARVKDGFAFEGEHDSDLISDEFLNTTEEQLKYRERLMMSSAPNTASSNPMSPILQAINTLTADPDATLRVVNDRIAKLEEELSKARKLRSLLEKTIIIDQPSTPKEPKPPSETWVRLEQSVYDTVMGMNGSAECKDIATALGVLPLQVRKAVASSRRMRKRAKMVEVI